jgi:hypothetical protein
VQSMRPDRAPWDPTKGVPVTRLPSLDEQNSRAHAAYRQVERYILETEIVPRITAEIIEEHRATPIGKHSDELERVLTYLRKNHLEMEGKYILDTEIVPRITAEIIEEHRATPIGKHSDELERVLTYLRKNHMEMEGKYILVCTKPHEEWRIAAITGEPDKPPVLLEDTFTNRFEAEHGLFMKRLRDNGLLEGVKGVAE